MEIHATSSPSRPRMTRPSQAPISTLLRTLAILLVALTPFRAAWANDAEPSSERCPGHNRALVLGGGGVRGAYQAGALWYLVNILGCDFAHYVGTSTGAVSAALLAQSASTDELKAHVLTLVKNYQDLTTVQDIVRQTFLGELRVVLPRWLAGVDGVYTLDPLVHQILRQIDFSRIPADRLTVPVISLQSGKIPDSANIPLIDRVIGSASLPFAIEPRRATVWVTGTVWRVEGDLLSVINGRFQGKGMFDLPAGLPPLTGCQIRVKDYGTFPCEYVTSTVKRTTQPFAPGWAELLVESEATSFLYQSLQLRVRELPDAARGKMMAVLERERKTGGFILKESKILEVEFTGSHQLVDGGVTDNVPLAEALRVWAWNKREKRNSFDTVFVLTTGSPRVPRLAVEEVKGGLQVAGRALDRLWETYQDKALGFDLLVPETIRIAENARKWIEAARAWRQQLEARLPSERLREIDAASASSFPMWDPELLHSKWLFDYLGVDGPLPEIYLIHPRQEIFEGTLEVDRQKIRNALYHGCQIVAQFFSSASKPIGNVYTAGFQVVRPQPVCEGLTFHGAP